MVAFLIRLSGLLLTFPQGDEPWELHGAVQVASSPLVHPEYYGNPPLLAYVLAPFVWLGFIGSEIRIVAALLSTLGIYVTYILIKTVLGDRVAFAAAGILAFLPAHVYTGQIVNRNVLLMLFSTAALYFFLRENSVAKSIFQRASLLSSLVAGGLTALAIMAKESGIALLAFYPAYVVLIVWREGMRELRSAKGIASFTRRILIGFRNLLPIYLFPVFTYLPWRIWATVNDYKYIHYGGYPPPPEAIRFTLLEVWRHFQGNPLTYFRILGWEYSLIILAVPVLARTRVPKIRRPLLLVAFSIVAAMYFLYRFNLTRNLFPSIAYGVALAVGIMVVVRFVFSVLDRSTDMGEAVLGTWALVWWLFMLNPKIELVYLMPVTLALAPIIVRDLAHLFTMRSSRYIYYGLAVGLSIGFILLSIMSGTNVLEYLFTLLAEK